MPRQIKLEHIGDYMQDQVLQLVRATTLEWEARVKISTPVDTGRLRGAWQSQVKGYTGEVTNNVEYAEAVCYGTKQSLPESWGGEYRTRQGTVPGFPEKIGKELEGWAQSEYQRIVRRG
jgi:hypothetical protein